MVGVIVGAGVCVGEIGVKVGVKVAVGVAVGLAVGVGVGFWNGPSKRSTRESGVAGLTPVSATYNLPAGSNCDPFRIAQQ